jgi:hypothetical protein
MGMKDSCLNEGLGRTVISFVSYLLELEVGYQRSMVVDVAVVVPRVIERMTEWYELGGCIGMEKVVGEGLPLILGKLRVGWI